MRGLGHHDKKRLLRDMVQRSRVEIVMDQESMLGVVDKRVIAEINSFVRMEWIFLLSLKTTGGIILWDKDHIVELNSRVDTFSVSLTTSRVSETSSWRVTAVYGPIDGSLSGGFLAELDSLRTGCDLPWCMGEDFNEVLYSNERSRGEGEPVELRGFEILWIATTFWISPLGGKIHLVEFSRVSLFQ